MMSGTGVLLTVGTLMSVINYSYLAELPSIEHKTFEEYEAYLSHKTNDPEWSLVSQRPEDKLTKEQFILTKGNYDDIQSVLNDTQCEDSKRYKQFIKDLPSEDENDVEFLYRIKNNEQCGENLALTVGKYIKKREEENLLDVEIEYLNKLIPLSKNDGRIKQLYLGTLYGNVLESTVKPIETLKTAWFLLINRLEPMLGEAYISYALRVIKKGKMPLPMDLIPSFFCRHLRLFENFDVWPEYNSSFVMTYIYSCPIRQVEQI